MKSHQDCVSRLDALSSKARAEFDAEPLLRDIAERNFEVAAQCVIDIAMRAGSIEQAPRTSDAGDAIRRMAELGILTPAAAAALAPIAGFRNVLVHEYLEVDWALVYAHFKRLAELRDFAAAVRDWLRTRDRGPN